MADDRRRAPSWRTTGASAAGKSGGPRAEPGTKRRGAGKRFLLLAAILALVGVIIGLVTYLRPTPEPLFLGVAVTDYAHPSYPPNPWAQPDSEALRRLFPDDSEQAFQGQEKQLLLQKLQNLADKTSKSRYEGRPVIVHLCALGVALGGKAYVLPLNAEPSVPSSWLALDEILAALRNRKGPCLLLLDIARPVADARLGVLSDDVAVAVHDELTSADAADKLPFLVLTACAPGQVSHTSPELRHSVFGYFLEQGLLGRADGWGGQATDERVSAKELAAYTIAQVAEWAVNNRLSPQTPMLYGKGDDFKMISPKKKPERDLTPLDEPRKYPEWLDKGWEERDKWVSDGTFRLVPRTFRQLEEAALRAERGWLARDDEDTVKERFERDKASLISRRNEFLPARITPRSLAEAKRVRVKDADEEAVASALRPFLERLKSKTPPNPMELADALKPFVKPPPEPTPSDALGLAGLKALTELNDPTPEQLKAFDDFFVKFLPEPRPADVLLLRYLMDHNARQLELWQRQELVTAKRLILQSGAAAERAAVADARTFPWIADALDGANRLRREGLLQLSTGEMKERESGVDKLEQAAAKYREIGEAAAALEGAFVRLDDAMILLPALARPLSNRPFDSADDRLWSGVYAAALELQPLLVPPEKPGLPPLPKLNSLSDSLNRRLYLLRAKFQADEAESIVRRGVPAEIWQALESPTWSKPNRIKLHDAARDQSRTLIQEAQVKSVKLQPGVAPLNVPAAPLPLPGWRAKLAIDLLKLGGMTDTKPLEAALDQASVNTSPQTWEQLGLEIRKAWVGTLSEEFSKPMAPTLAQRQAGFIVHPFDVSSVPLPQDSFKREPAPLIRGEQATLFWNWLAERRYLADGAAIGAYRNRTEMVDYGKKLEDVGRDLQNRKP